ncbi:LysR family transcriptional regulator [Photobacterium jeanii]|uniref:LysR family transcriptional regulator n=1 Tax=Photobacterium jeanii TaxID=858640 RepID=UPI0018DB20E3|nr:LysR family transcriptional regulator [Photobacterium jeanii]
MEQLEAFVETVERGSFKQASYRLGKHTTTISGLVANLEAEMGLDLFVRKPRSLEITQYGKEIYQYAKSVIRENEHLAIKANSLLQGVPTKLSIAVDLCLTDDRWFKILSSIMTKYPTLELQVLNGDPMQVRSWVLTSQADIGFSLNTFHRHHELSVADGYRFRVISVASPSLGLKNKVVSAEELRGELQVGALFMKQLGQEETHNFSNRMLYSNNMQSTLALIKSSPTWGLLPEFLCYSALKNGDVEQFFLSPTETTRPNQWSTEVIWALGKPMNAAMELFLSEVTALADRE